MCGSFNLFFFKIFELKLEKTRTYRYVGERQRKHILLKLKGSEKKV